METMKDKFVLITGGANVDGIGMATAVLLRERGARVLVSDLHDTAPEAVTRAGLDYVKLDVTAEADWQRVAEQLRAAGGLTGLVNNAACYIPRPLAETTTAQFELQFRVNQLGAFLGMQTISPLLVANGGGSIINMSSTAGLQGSVSSFAYSSTKWAVRGMTKSAALALAGSGVRVNSVHPGPIGTQLLSNRTPEQRAFRATQVPLQREGTVQEVAELAVFLLSDQSSYSTGSEFVMDGGVTL